MERLKLSEFIELYVDRNTVIHLYERHPYVSITKDVEKEVSYERKETAHKELWSGMEWQCLHIDYCKKRGFEICPYKDNEVLKVINMTKSPFADEIDLLMEENTEVEYEEEGEK